MRTVDRIAINGLALLQRDVGGPPSVNRTTRVLQADPGTLAGEDPRFVEHLLVDAPALAVELTAALVCLLRRRSDESLEAWREEADGTPLAGFAAGLRRDVEAVRGMVETRWSTSPVEGQLTRLKMLKRAVYGRGL